MYRMTKHIGGNGNPAEQTYRHQNVNGDGPFSPNEYFTMPYVGRRAFSPTLMVMAESKVRMTPPNNTTLIKLLLES